ncbi:MAG: gliding motility-associated C-terminal domain-containing protein [Bacteroidia bacterium]
MKLKQLFLILVIFLITSDRVHALITIDSVNTILSSCSNNGVATVFAKSSLAGPLLYAITSGPILASIQNSNVFSSLYPGSYNLRVYDVNFDSLDYQFQITGNYQLPDFILKGVDPTCPGFTDGSITVIVDSTKGLAPYTFEIVSPIVVPSQASRFFPNLTDNTYFVRVTDACGNYQTRVEVLLNTGTALDVNTYIVPVVVKIGCDTIKVSSTLYLYKEKWNQPITVTYSTPLGIITKQATLNVIDTINYNPGYFEVADTIAGLTYGDFLKVEFSDVCGITVSSIVDTIAPFEFEILFSPTTVNCVSTFSGSVELKHYPNYPYHYSYSIPPLSFVLTDVTTGNIVDSGRCIYQYCSIYLIPQVPGNLYNLTITDGCGDVWQDVILWPSSGSPEVNIYPNYGCLDSTASLGIQCLGFQSAPWITFLSGPPNAGSTKPFYTYNDTIIYPQVFFGLNTPSFISVKDFPKGSYTFQVEDSCGNIVQGVFVVEDFMLSNLSFSWSVKPSCFNNNTLFYNFEEGTGCAVYASITDLATNQVIVPVLNYYVDSISTLPIGTYALEIYYLNHLGNGQYFDGGLVHSGVSCWVLHDTIRIQPYNSNYFLTNSTVYCNGTYYLSIEVDSSRGVPPYQYAIISGPQTFPLQDSSFFQISGFGNYVISMEDVCGNNYTQQISVTSDSLSPIIRGGFFCEGNFASLTLPSSNYFTNIWHLPNGNTFIGDSLLFQPFISADTGQYLITTIVSINGCLDSIERVIYVSGRDSVNQAFAICPGDSVFVGSNVYYTPGVYFDTLSTVLGCDSILITNITIQTDLLDSNAVSICAGDSILVGSNYYSIAGIYVDTIFTTGNCEKIIVTQLTVNSFIDSISAVLCQGDTFMVGNILHLNAGVFTDTLTASSGCDSLIVVDISFNPLIIDSNAFSICNGDSILVGSVYYSSSGTYIDTVITTGNCKKIMITQLTVNSIIDSISATMCQGDTFKVGSTIYLTSGIFSDTLAAVSGCDSIIISNLTFINDGYSYVMDTICFGDSVYFGNTYLNVAGTYYDTLSASNCDSIVEFILTVLPIIPLTITSSATVIWPGETIVLNSTLQSGWNYYWYGNANFASPFSSTTNATLDSVAWIFLTITSFNGCQATDSILLTVEFEQPSDSCKFATIFIPNAFTPNDDGINDLYEVVTTNVTVENYKIFSRWGELIFESSDYEKKWDGKFKNERCPAGVYVYIVEYKNCPDEVVKFRKGFLTLLE